MNLELTVFEHMSWYEYELAIQAFLLKNARNWEPNREHMVLYYNSLAEKGKGKSAIELFPLLSDTEVAQTAEEMEDANAELWNKLTAIPAKDNKNE